jgi:hypothetical protein
MANTVLTLEIAATAATTLVRNPRYAEYPSLRYGWRELAVTEEA